MSAKHEIPEHGLAEVIQFPRKAVDGSERLAELDARIKAAFDEIHELLGERREIEKRHAA
ncbi:hypothetical protein [Glycomyces buryatensis]|uniref:Uncharacterized protein n=1 Tax=Glycomyces buryatensis TaxID=2570927 RepID=A0A4S8QKE2_9ACTN|nr:hypothetical protein [Glycomyces buryatensis]THV43465.1 hypothetical protein FAB82_00980 [Glycomyces buryatensis]